MAIIRVWTTDGKVYDEQVPYAALSPKQHAEKVGRSGFWAPGGSRDLYYPPSSIKQIEVMDKATPVIIEEKGT